MKDYATLTNQVSVAPLISPYFELPKLPKTVTADDGLVLWLSLFKARTEEELADLEALGVQDMSETISAYRQITVTPEFREMERLRSKARHDEAQALYNAERKRTFEIAQNALRMSLSVDEIIKLTGLTREEVEGLKND